MGLGGCAAMGCCTMDGGIGLEVHTDCILQDFVCMHACRAVSCGMATGLFISFGSFGTVWQRGSEVR